MSQAIVDYLADGLIGGTALALVALAICSIPAVRARASLVFAIWIVVIARFLVPGLVPIDLPLSAATTAGPAPEIAASYGDVAPAMTEVPSRWPMWIAIAWLVAVTGIAAFTGRSWLRLRRAIARLPDAPAPVAERAAAIAAKLGLSRKIAIKLDDRRGPFAAGVIAPVVVIPRSLDGDDLDDVLAHELAHHRRRDPLFALVSRAAHIVFFFWPVIWLAGRRLAAARERATDQLAVDRGDRDRRHYARTLVRMTMAARRRPAMAMASGASQLRSRIDELLAGAPAGVGRAGVALLVALIALGLPAARLAAAEPDPGPLECTITPGLGARILASHPGADRDGDGVLSRDEICEHQRRMHQRLVDAAVRADVVVDEEMPFSPAAVTALAGAAELEIEMADAGGAVCTAAETANRCVEEMVLIDVSAE